MPVHFNYEFRSKFGCTASRCELVVLFPRNSNKHQCFSNLNIYFVCQVLIYQFIFRYDVLLSSFGPLFSSFSVSIVFLSSYPAFFPPLSPSPSHNYQHHHHYWHQHCYLNQADRGSIVKVFLFAYFLLVFVYVISFRFQILELKRRILFHLAIFYKEQLSLQNS